MGRKPNPIILQFFERGPRLADNSNRYPHRCKACGESFPKGRAESLMTHISKKCPAISESDRLSACLSLNGLSHHIANTAAVVGGVGPGVGGVGGVGGVRGNGSRAAQHHGLQQAHRLGLAGSPNGSHLIPQTHAHHHHLLATANGAPGAAAAAAAAAAVAAAAAAAVNASPNSAAVDAAAIQRDWTALETLAEVSRQIDLSEKHDDRAPGSSGSATNGGDGSASNKNSVPPGTFVHESSPSKKPFDASDLLKSDPVTIDDDEHHHHHHQHTTGADGHQAPDADMMDGGVSDQDRITIDQIKRLEEANLSMAAAATAQLNPSLLDPQLRADDHAIAANVGTPQSVGSAAMTDAKSLVEGITDDQQQMQQVQQAQQAQHQQHHVDADVSALAAHNMADTSAMVTEDEQMADALADATNATNQPWGEITYLAENVLPVFPTGDHLPSSPGDPNRISFNMNHPNEKPKQGRARFNTTRRKEVQEVRRIGACIRCRILRKTCSKGSPCDQCRKVLSPRVWRSGCVRTKFTEQLDIFCAGVQVVLAQHRTNQLRDAVDLVNKGLTIEATHFPENPAVAVTLEVFQSNGPKDPASVAAAVAAAAEAAAAAAAVPVSNDDTSVTAPSQNGETPAAETAEASQTPQLSHTPETMETADTAPITETTDSADIKTETEAKEHANGDANGEAKTNPTTDLAETSEAPLDAPAEITEVPVQTAPQSVAEAATEESTSAPAPVAPSPPKHFEIDEIVMVDTAKDDVPLKMEYYMRNMLPQFIQRESSPFVRVMLETSMTLANNTGSVLLKKAIELWGLIEILDSERQWQIRVKPANQDADSATASNTWRQIRADTDQDIYTTVSLQLTAGAERKAASISHSLLTTMQRLLQDSKTKIDYTMYFTTLILLNCVEKSTWGFKAWDQDPLRAMWPLERTPSDFAQQGYVIADLLRMLLGIRKALPRTTCRPEDGMLVTEEDDPLMRSFFESISLKYNEVIAKHDHPVFSPTDSRSFELLFCSSLLVNLRD